jgi:hypothetical protein
MSRKLFALHAQIYLITNSSFGVPPLVPGGGTHSLAVAGVGGPNSDEGTDTVVF